MFARHSCVQIIHISYCVTMININCQETLVKLMMICLLFLRLTVKCYAQLSDIVRQVCVNGKILPSLTSLYSEGLKTDTIMFKLDVIIPNYLVWVSLLFKHYNFLANIFPKRICLKCKL